MSHSIIIRYVWFLGCYLFRTQSSSHLHVQVHTTVLILNFLFQVCLHLFWVSSKVSGLKNESKQTCFEWFCFITPTNLGWTWYLVESMWLWTWYAETRLGVKPPVIAFLSALEVRLLETQRPSYSQMNCHWVSENRHQKTFLRRTWKLIFLKKSMAFNFYFL